MFVFSNLCYLTAIVECMLNHICQNVPVTTAMDMAEQVLKFCDGRLSNQMWDTDYIVQDNRKQSIVSEIKLLLSFRFLKLADIFGSLSSLLICKAIHPSPNRSFLT